MSPTPLSRTRAALLGLAVGDAVGTTLEFKRRGSFAPIRDMTGGGPFALTAGQWTDDTSMALCLATSLVESDGFDARDQMERYCLWQTDGYLSSTGRCFDIGNTVAAALRKFRITGDPFAGDTDPRSAGNGSLMRLAPAVLCCAHDREAALHSAAQSSRTTHAAPECLDACRIFAELLLRALAGATRDEIFAPVAGRFCSDALNEIARHGYRAKPSDAIRGTGYVVQSLEAALWCFATTDDFRSAVLAAANLGDDADTTAAICGQLAGAHYGEAGIPEEWLAKLSMREAITGLADRLHGMATAESRAWRPTS